MYVRISWGRVHPGSWEDYEKAFKESVEAAGHVNGLVARALNRDIDDPNTGYSISWWDSAEAMEAYETGAAVDLIQPRIEQYFGGAFITNRLEVVMEKRYDEVVMEKR
jgi:heme-degrading monooxygenase HmoA